MIPWELSKTLKFGHTEKRYVHKLKSSFEYQRNKILLDTEMQTEYPILARRPGRILINKKKRFLTIGICCSDRIRSENKRKQKDREILKFCQGDKEANTNCK